MRRSYRERSRVFIKGFTTCLVICYLKPFLRTGTVTIPGSPKEKLRLGEEAEVSDGGR